jgi:hypothetical protein
MEMTPEERATEVVDSVVRHRASVNTNNEALRIQIAASIRVAEDDARKMVIDLVIERAEQACRYALKHQNFNSDTDPEYRSGWEVAASVCEGAIRPQVERHIADDVVRAESTRK